MTTQEVLRQIVEGFGFEKNGKLFVSAVTSGVLEMIDTLKGDSTTDQVKILAAEIKETMNLRGKPFLVEAKLMQYVKNLKR